jgi:hypothetical protein
MNKLDSLFDLKQFVVAFGEATHDSSITPKESQPIVQTAESSVEAKLSWDNRRAPHDGRLRGKQK